jgi:hypothetical protein
MFLSLICAAAVILLVIIFRPPGIFPVKRVEAPEGEPGKEEYRVIKLFDFSSDGDLSQWEEKALASKKTDYTLAELDGSSCIKAVSEDSASALFFKRRISFEGDPYIAWDWKAELFPEKQKEESLRDKDEFDFVGQVYVIFYAAFYLNAEAIQYVWSSELAEGMKADSPYTGKVKLLVLESGPAEGWKHEMRNIAEDYRELFGRELDTDLMAISFMTDADSTSTRSVAYFDNIQVGYLTGGRKIDIPSEEEEDEREVSRGTEISVKER